MPGVTCHPRKELGRYTAGRNRLLGLLPHWTVPLKGRLSRTPEPSSDAAELHGKPQLNCRLFLGFSDHFYLLAFLCLRKETSLFHFFKIPFIPVYIVVGRQI